MRATESRLHSMECAAIKRLVTAPAMMMIVDAITEELYRTGHVALVRNVEEDLRRKVLVEFLKTSPHSTYRALRIYPTVVEWIVGCVHVALIRMIEQQGFPERSAEIAACDDREPDLRDGA